jgi:shikimate dehydrogenase
MSSIRLGLIGHNISWSKSTDIFEAMFRRSSVDGSFEVFDLPPSQLAEWLKTVAPQLRGFAATIPHKQRLMRHLDDIDSRARSIGAVNSVAVEGIRLCGYNTDYDGVVSSLRPYEEQIAGKGALILGAGGAARAVLHSLVREFAFPRFVVAARTVQTAEMFRTEHERKLGGVEIEIGTLDEPHWSMSDIGLIVNCTPLSGYSHPLELPPVAFGDCRTAVYFDLNYNRPNQAVALAREAGLVAFDGALMLVTQAVASFRLWTGLKVDAQEIMRDVFDNEQP